MGRCAILFPRAGEGAVGAGPSIYVSLPNRCPSVLRAGPTPALVEAKDRPGRAWLALDHSTTGLVVCPLPPGYSFLPLPRRNVRPAAGAPAGLKSSPVCALTGRRGVRGERGTALPSCLTLCRLSPPGLEMSARLLHSEALESAHRPQLLAPGAALRPPDGAEELQRRRGHAGAETRSAAGPASPGARRAPGPLPHPSLPAELLGRAPALPQAGPVSPRRPRGWTPWAPDGSEDEPPKDSDGEDSRWWLLEAKPPTQASPTWRGQL